MASGVRPGVLDRGRAGFDRQAWRWTHPRPAIASLADAGALDDPLVAGVDALFELGVGEPLVGECGAPAGDRGPHAQATRSQATGWPSRRRSPRWTSMPTSWPRNGLHDGSRCTRTVEVTDGLALVDVVARVDVVERPEHAHRRGDDHALGHEEPFTVVQEGFHGLCDLQGRVEGDVVGGGEVADGDVGGAALGEGGEHRAVARPPRTCRRRGPRACPWSSASAPAPRRAAGGVRASRRRRS